MVVLASMAITPIFVVATTSRLFASTFLVDQHVICNWVFSRAFSGTLSLIMTPPGFKYGTLNVISQHTVALLW